MRARQNNGVFMLVRYIKFLASFSWSHNTSLIRRGMFNISASNTVLIKNQKFRPLQLTPFSPEQFSASKERKFHEKKSSYSRQKKSDSHDFYNFLPWFLNLSRTKNSKFFLLGTGVLLASASADPDKDHVINMTNLIVEGLDKIKLAKEKDVILVIGATGAGKSTLVDYLLDYEMRLENTVDGPCIEGVELVPAKIGIGSTKI